MFTTAAKDSLDAVCEVTPSLGDTHISFVSHHGCLYLPQQYAVLHERSPQTRYQVGECDNTYNIRVPETHCADVLNLIHLEVHRIVSWLANELK